MKRLHLFGFQDQVWFPSTLRDAGTAFLEHMVRITGQAIPLVPKLKELVAKTGCDRFIDLYPGGGGPLPIIVREMRESGVEVHATLTDLYPSRELFERHRNALPEAIDFCSEPVDATRIPQGLHGIRTLFNAFHHFRPEMAHSILEAAVKDKSPIAIFELVGREPLCLVGVLFSWLTALFAMPFIRPLRPSWLFFTYVLPIIPLFIVWDGIVSCMRVYSPAELESLTESLASVDEDYQWEIGKLRLDPVPLSATYLIGTPTRTG